MNKYIQRLAVVGGFGLVLAGCGGSGNPVFTPGTPATTNKTYTQIERLSRPAIKEVFEGFVQHQTSNATEPYDTTNDPLYANIKGTEDLLRPPKNGLDYGATLQSILYPDVLRVNLDGTAGGYLGVETGNTAASFGGRNPNDDVIATSLGALFGNTLSKLGVIGDDGQENTCIAQENTPPTVATTTTFPYLQQAH